MFRILCLFGLHFRTEDKHSPDMVCMNCGNKKPLWDKSSKAHRKSRRSNG